MRAPRRLHASSNRGVQAERAHHLASLPPSWTGVAVNAPASVIEAALEAQLRERDVARLDGLAPDLQRMMLEQREALIRARDLLVR